jgi:all-trans-retinol 13,14-reductase
MTSALLLAAAGRSVALVESFPRLAPTIRGFSRQGVHFDTGLHYVGGLGAGDPLRTYFSHLGILPSIIPVPYDPMGFDTFVFEESGKSYNIPAGRDSINNAFFQWFPEEQRAITEYFDSVGDVFNSSPFLNFALPFSMHSALHDNSCSLSDFLNRLTSNERLKVLLKYPCLLYGVAPEDALFSTHALVAGSYYRSAHAVEGGGASVANAFQSRLASLGVDILCGNAVRDIVISGDGAFSGVTLENDHKIAADQCIWAAHPKSMLQAAPSGALRGPFRQRIEALEETQSALMLFGLSDGQPVGLERRNLILWPGGDFRNKLAGEATMAENVVFLFAGQGGKMTKAPVTAMTPANSSRFMPWHGSKTGKRPSEYAQGKNQALDEFKVSLKQRCPKVADNLQFIEGATPLTIRDYCQAPGGGLYGVRHSINQFNPQPLTRIRGLLMCGQSIVAPGILGAVVSAYLACGFILGHESLHQQLQEVA